MLFRSLNLRYEEIQSTIDDLQLSKKELLLNIKEVETEIEFRIESSFNSISVHFSEIFETLFPGGKGSLSFTDKTNILETGIEISVQPRGKKVKKLSLLSGGERSLAAIAFLFSIFKSFPSPFYILDEVEAALLASSELAPCRAAVAEIGQCCQRISMLTDWLPEYLANESLSIEHIQQKTCSLMLQARHVLKN